MTTEPYEVKVEDLIDKMQDDPILDEHDCELYNQGWNDAISVIKLLIEDVTPPGLKEKWMEFLARVLKQKNKGYL